MSHVMAIDFGTSGCRSAIYNENLEMLCVSTAEYPLILHSEKEIEQDAELWWQCCLQTMRKAIEDAPIPASSIRSISISSQGIAFVPIAEDGHVLYNAISWLDTRAEKELADIEQRYGGQAIYQRTGKRLSPLYTLPKLIWFKEHCKDVYAQAWKILLPLDFIQFKLSGKCVCDHTMAGGTMFYDAQTRSWAKDILDDYGLDIAKLPDIAWSGEVIGTILPDVAEKVGLSKDVLIVNGAQDQKCAALGAGAAECTAAVSLGTGACIAQLSTVPISDPDMRIPFFSYTKEGLWDFEGVINTAGSAYSWFRNVFGDGKSFPELNELAEGISLPNHTFFYPFLAGSSSPYWGEATGSFYGLSLNTGFGHMVRAVMEGIAYNIRANLDLMGRICKRATEIRLYGGGSKSPLWCQIIADVTNIPVVTLSSSETALAGAAMLAYAPLECLSLASLPTAAVYTPSSEAVAMYGYQKYEAV